MNFISLVCMLLVSFAWAGLWTSNNVPAVIGYGVAVLLGFVWQAVWPIWGV